MFKLPQCVKLPLGGTLQRYDKIIKICANFAFGAIRDYFSANKAEISFGLHVVAEQQSETRVVYNS